MIDRDNIIDGLNEIMHYNGKQMFYNDIFIRGIAEDALALLKEQEPIEPTSYMDGIVQRFTCGKCGKHLLYARWGRYDFCPYCGQEVKWNA